MYTHTHAHTHTHTRTGAAPAALMIQIISCWVNSQHFFLFLLAVSLYTEEYRFTSWQAVNFTSSSCITFVFRKHIADKTHCNRKSQLNPTLVWMWGCACGRFVPEFNPISIKSILCSPQLKKSSVTIQFTTTKRKTTLIQFQVLPWFPTRQLWVIPQGTWTKKLNCTHYWHFYIFVLIVLWLLLEHLTSCRYSFLPSPYTVLWEP